MRISKQEIIGQLEESVMNITDQVEELSKALEEIGATQALDTMREAIKLMENGIKSIENNEGGTNMKTPKITENKHWSPASVRNACIDNDLYTRGDNEDYEHMLDWVSRLYPNVENLYFIAEDIVKHSANQTVTNVMFILANDAVFTTFEIDGRDDA